MCHTIHCFMRMQGHGKHVDSLEQLLGLLGQMSGPKQPPEMDHATWLAELAERLEVNARATEVAQGILKQEPPEEGAKLVGLEVLKPADPKEHGVLTIAIYALESGTFRVIGVDHLSQFTLSHDTPNVHGLDGLMDATRVELEHAALGEETQDATVH